MAWIETIPPERATGPLRRLYEAALSRAGKVFNVVRVQGIAPRSLRASTQLYSTVMFDEDSPLSRARREMIATVVSRVNGCRY